MNKKQICFVVSAPDTAISFLKDHIAAFSSEFDVYLVANMQHPDQVKDLQLCDSHIIRIERGINLWKDLVALWQLWRYFRRMNFHVVHSVTPKAGLVAAIASFFACVPHRVHIYTGQVWATRRGLMRSMLIAYDKIIARLNTRLLVDGESQRQYLIKHGVLTSNNAEVLGAGSICGVNTGRFTPDAAVREGVRQQLNIGENRVVFAFMGRLNREKGVYELLSAFNQLSPKAENAYLLLIGRDEENCLASIGEYENIKSGDNFYYYGPTPSPEKILQAADVFCLPSYREGFGSSVIEASCLGLPVICSDAYGVMDAMIEHETGLRCKVGDDASLLRCMMKLCSDGALRERLGVNGRQRVLANFSASAIVSAWLDFYKSFK